MGVLHQWVVLSIAISAPLGCGSGDGGDGAGKGGSGGGGTGGKGLDGAAGWATGGSGAAGGGATGGTSGVGATGGASGASGAGGTLPSGGGAPSGGGGSAPLGYPPGDPNADATCTGPGGEAGTKCGGIADAHVANGVNVGYYPFKVKAGVSSHLYTCDNRTIETLDAGQGFALQSTRNPSCSDNPPIRPELNGFVFGYARGSATSGWIPAADIEFAGYGGGNCADGPASADFEVAKNPHDGCKALVCSGNQTCASTNGPNDGANDCGGKTMNVTKTVSATDMYLRYAPLSTAVRYLHKGDQVKVLYDNLKGWSFVEVSGTTCPVLTPNGVRGWCETSYLQ